MADTTFQAAKTYYPPLEAYGEELYTERDHQRAWADYHFGPTFEPVAEGGFKSRTYPNRGLRECHDCAAGVLVTEELDMEALNRHRAHHDMIQNIQQAVMSLKKE